jgi:hypothetical protein
MAIRNLLSYELWSKETTRKALSRVWRILKPVSIALGLLAVLLFVTYEVGTHWLTSGEREAGNAALAQLEKLDALRYCKCEQFAVVNEQAKKAVQVARSKAWTIRDGQLVKWLELYRWMVETENASDLRNAEVNDFAARRHLRFRVDPQIEVNDQKLKNEHFRLVRGLLHQFLD